MNDTEGIYFRSPKDNSVLIEEEYEEEKNEDDIPMALIVEDDQICQMSVSNELKNMGLRYRIATTVTEARDEYLKLAQESINIDLVFLDLLLRDGSTGLDFLKMIRQNHLMEKTLIIVMSGVDDMKIVSQCYNYKIQNFIQKPISKQNFLTQKFKIKSYLESIKCPLPGYRIEKEIGSGASAVVHLVQHKKSKLFFAMKEVSLPAGEKNLTQPNEVKYLKNIKGPTIIGLKESKMVAGKLYMVLEYAEYGTLNDKIRQKIREGSKFDVEQILDWMTMIYIGLFVIHKKKVMHRDIKSDNLFLCKDDVVKIGDLGIARSAVNAQTICGTAFYMAPEMYSYQTYSYTIDIWAAGVVLYELVLLKKPFEGLNEEEMKKKILESDFEIPEDLDSRIKRLLSLTLTKVEKRAKAKELLSISFIHQRALNLFKTKLNDEALFKKVSSIEELPPNARLSFEDSIESLKSKEYLKYFKNASTLNTKIPKTSYKPSVLSWTMYDLIDSYYIQYPDEDMNIQTKDIQDLLAMGLLTEITAKKGKFFKINLFEKEWIDNSFNFPIDKSLLLEDIQNPLKLSSEVLTLAFELWNELKFISEDDDQKGEFKASGKLFEFYMLIKRLSKLPIRTYTRNQQLALMLNLYETMYLHYIIKYLLYEEMLQKMSIITNIISLFFSYKSNIEVIYEIDGSTLSLFDLKHIVLRRNKKIPNSLFKGAYSSDPRISFISEPLNPSIDFMLDIHCVCPDFPHIIVDEDLLVLDPIIACYNESSVFEDMACHAKKFLKDNITLDEHCINIPSLFKEYIRDFGGNEMDVIQLLFKYYFSENERKKSNLTLSKINQGYLTINYI